MQPWPASDYHSPSFTEPHEIMYAAIRDDNMVELERLLASGAMWHRTRANPVHNIETAGGWSMPLHFASWLGNHDAVRSLLGAGADPTVRCWVGLGEGYDATPLELAIGAGHQAIVRTLWGARAAIGNGAGFGRPGDLNRCSYLCLCARAGHAAILRDLLAWEDWDHEVKLAALKAATSCWRFHAVDTLLELISFNTLELHAMLHKAVSFREPSADELYPQTTPLEYLEEQLLIERLIDAGADPDYYLDDFPPLVRAAYWAPASLSAMRTLLEKGANPDLQDGDGNTAFHLLTSRIEWCSTAIWLLLKHHANADLKNIDGVTALQLSAQFAPTWADFLPVLQTCIMAKRPANSFSSASGETLLHFAALGGRRETMQMLVAANGMDVNATTRTGWTPFMFALLPKIHNGNPHGNGTLHEAIRSARFLLSQGANPLCTTDENWTPLHVLSLHLDASPDGEAKAFALELIGLGCPADPASAALALSRKWHAMSEHIRSPEDRWQKLPLLHWAALHGAVDVVKALLENGADALKEDEYLRTAREVADESEFLRGRVSGGGPFRGLGPVGKMMIEVLDKAGN